MVGEDLQLAARGWMTHHCHLSEPGLLPVPAHNKVMVVARLSSLCTTKTLIHFYLDKWLMGERRGGRQDKVVLGHRKRIKTEKEAKVVVFFWGGEFI